MAKYDAKTRKQLTLAIERHDEDMVRRLIVEVGLNQGR